MVHIFTIIANYCMLWTRVVNTLVLTCNKQFLSNRMSYAIFCILCNYFYINTRDIRQLNSSVTTSAMSCFNKSFSWFRKYHLRSMQISFFSRLIFQNTIFKALKSHSITNIFLSSTRYRDNFNTCWWDIE